MVFSFVQKTKSLAISISGLESGLGFRGMGFLDLGLGFKVLDLGFRGSGFGVWHVSHSLNSLKGVMQGII